MNHLLVTYVAFEVIVGTVSVIYSFWKGFIVTAFVFLMRSGQKCYEVARCTMTS